MDFGTLFKNIEVLGGHLLPPEREVSGITSDSRRCREDFLFVCIPGTKTDGHRYISEALSRGCSCLVVLDASFVPSDIPHVLVKDTRLAEAILWNTWCGEPARDLTVFGVTGTNGKTSVTQMLRCILRAASYRVASLGTLGCEYCDVPGEKCGGSSVCDKAAAMTTPDAEYLYPTLRRLKAQGCRAVVMEASSHALSQEKLAPLRFSCGIFTNLSPEHLDHHKTMEAYATAKETLFRQADRAVINTGNPWGKRLAEKHLCPTVSCSAKDQADYMARRIKSLGSAGIEYDLDYPGGTLRITSSLPGFFSVENTLLAAATALEAGIDGETVTRALAAFGGVKGRLERVSDGRARDYSVFIDYAHTPEALESLLKTVREFTVGRIILLFGCGGDRDRAKRPLMGAIAGRLADFTVITSDNSRAEDPLRILSDILTGFPVRAPHAVLSHRRTAIRFAVDNARPGDVVILAGKGHETYEIDENGMHPFDEAAIAIEAMRLRDI